RTDRGCDCSVVVVFCFFFQAEDGIRDFHVTGVQTCALPISQNDGQGQGKEPERQSLGEIQGNEQRDLERATQCKSRWGLRGRRLRAGGGRLSVRIRIHRASSIESISCGASTARSPLTVLSL